MSRLWNTLKSVVGSAGRMEVENVLKPAVTVVSTSSDGIFHNLASVKPHTPLIKFR